MEKNKIVKSWELKATSQKSFYKKAYVLEDEKGSLYLQSYDTIVCGIINGIFKKFWDGYSRTTQTHINDFRNAHNLSTLYKKDWELLSTDNDPVSYYDHKDANMGNKKEFETYDNIIKSIVKKCGGYREKDIMKNPYIIRKTETWDNDHKVLNIIEKNSSDNHNNGFSIDLVTMEICG